MYDDDPRDRIVVLFQILSPVLCATTSATVSRHVCALVRTYNFLMHPCPRYRVRRGMHNRSLPRKCCTYMVRLPSVLYAIRSLLCSYFDM